MTGNYDIIMAESRDGAIARFVDEWDVVSIERLARVGRGSLGNRELMIRSHLDGYDKLELSNVSPFRISFRSRRCAFSCFLVTEACFGGHRNSVGKFSIATGRGGSQPKQLSVTKKQEKAQRRLRTKS